MSQPSALHRRAQVCPEADGRAGVCPLPRPGLGSRPERDMPVCGSDGRVPLCEEPGAAAPREASGRRTQSEGRCRAGPGLAGSESGSPGGRAGLAHHRESPPRLSRTFFWFPTEQPVPGRLLWGTRTCRPALASSQGPGGRRRWAAKALGAGAAPPRAPVPLHAHLVQHACPGGRAGTSPAAGRGVASPPGRGRDAGARSQRRPALGALTFPGLGRSGPRRGRRLSWPRRTDRSWSWPSPDPQ